MSGDRMTGTAHEGIVHTHYRVSEIREDAMGSRWQRRHPPFFNGPLTSWFVDCPDFLAQWIVVCFHLPHVYSHGSWSESEVKVSCVQLFATPWTIQSIEFSRPEYWSAYSLLQGLFPTQGLNPGLLHCRWTLYQLSHKGSPRMLEWVAYPFFSGSPWPRNWTGVSCIAGGFFTSWAIREAPTGVSVPTWVGSNSGQESQTTLGELWPQCFRSF